MATLTAVIAAREHHDVRPSEQSRHVVYVGEHRHHSIDRALRHAGVSECPVRVVASGPRYRMDVTALQQVVRADVAAGLKPWLVVATAGTTSSGGIDPIAEVVGVARSVGAWVHVDAAYGGLFALTDRARPPLTGLGEADSVVVDPHKTLFQPYGTGALLVRDRALLRDVFAQSADYLPVDAADSPADLGLELTRPFRALGLWFSLQLFGSEAFAAALAANLDLAGQLHETLAADARFEVGPPPDLTVVTYRAIPDRGDPEEFNRELLRRIQAAGEVYITATVLDGRFTLRAAIGSHRTTEDDVSTFVDVLRLQAEKLAAQ